MTKYAGSPPVVRAAAITAATAEPTKPRPCTTTTLRPAARCSISANWASITSGEGNCDGGPIGRGRCHRIIHGRIFRFSRLPGALVVREPPDIEPVFHDGEAHHRPARGGELLNEIGHVKALVLRDEFIECRLE